MDRSYIESDKRATKIGLWILFFNFLIAFNWLIYELYESFNSVPNYRWEFSFNLIGIPFALIFIGLILFAITRALIKEIYP
jgi:apolipoprotein N-acyltransferase